MIQINGNETYHRPEKMWNCNFPIENVQNRKTKGQNKKGLTARTIGLLQTPPNAWGEKNITGCRTVLTNSNAHGASRMEGQTFNWFDRKTKKPQMCAKGTEKLFLKRVPRDRERERETERGGKREKGKRIRLPNGNRGIIS